MRSSIFGMAILLATVQPARASFAEVPLEVLVDEANVIVQGKVARIDGKGFELANRPYAIALVEVASVLKGPDGLKQVGIAQPAAEGPVVSSDIVFRSGQEGIWLLTRDPERDVYWAKHPSQLQPLKEKDALAKLVAERAKLPAGKPVNGLVARAELLEQASGYDIRFSLKNVSDRPIVIGYFVGSRPLHLNWVGPDGAPRQDRHYDFLQRARLRAMSKDNFATLLPGGVRFLESIPFLTTDMPEKNYVEPGRHKIAVRYVNEADGKQFELKDVWTGTVTSNEVVLTVK